MDSDRCTLTQETLRKTEDNIKSTPEHSLYIANKSYVDNPKNRSASDYETRKQKVEQYENDYKAKTEPLRNQINFYRRELGIPDGSGASTQTAPKAETVTVGDKTYTKPANMTDQQWAKYKKDMGVK